MFIKKVHIFLKVENSFWYPVVLLVLRCLQVLTSDFRSMVVLVINLSILISFLAIQTHSKHDTIIKFSNKMN